MKYLVTAKPGPMPPPIEILRERAGMAPGQAR